jgi:5-methyltetrahydropteroyltriglutamate--homocysteine methyltransferase
LAFDKSEDCEEKLKLQNQMWCREVITELKEAGASWIQMDEPKLVMDIESCQYNAFKKAYAVLGEVSGVKLLVETYFTDLPAESYL